MRLFEVATANVRNRNVVIKEEYLQNYIKRAQEDKQELYRSYYAFDERMFAHMQQYKTCRSFKGEYYMFRLLLDIDKGKDTNEFVLQRAREFVKRLNEDWNIDYENMRYWFSGSGYHIEIPNIFKLTNSEDLPEIWKETANKCFPETDTKPLIRTGLIRVGYTINLKTNLYKIPLTQRELFKLKYEEIHKLAETYIPRELDEVGDLQTDLDYSKEVVIPENKATKINYVHEPGSNVTCMSKLWNRGPIEGSRHNDMLRLISSLRRKDIPKNIINMMMLQWAHTMDAKEVEKMVNNTYEARYEYGCQDHVMKSFCDEKCIFFKNKNYGNNFKGIEEVENAYVQFIRSNFEHTAFDLAKVFPGMDPFMIYPKEFVVLIGDTKLGKTALMQNICAKLKSFNILYYTLETSELLMYRRQVQIEHGYSKAQVMNYYKEFTNTLSNKIKHIKFTEIRPTLSDIESHIIDYQPKLIIIDTLQKIRAGKLFDDYKNREEKIAFELSALAKKYSTIVIAVHHVSKDSVSFDSKGKKRELGVHSGKGDSAVEQEADKVIIFEGEEQMNRRKLRSAAARDEAPFNIDLFYKKENFRMFKI